MAFEDALLAGDRQRASGIVERILADGCGLVVLEMHVIQPALQRIGWRWQNNLVSVAQEHLATAIAQSAMTLGLMHSEPARPNGKKVLLACVAGNHHAVGLQMVADGFQLSGWEVQFLGADMPTHDLVQQVVAWRPDLVGLSICFEGQLSTAKQVLQHLEEALGHARPPVLIGGLAIDQSSTLIAQLGAEGWSPDAKSAVASGAILVGLSA